MAEASRQTMGARFTSHEEREQLVSQVVMPTRDHELLAQVYQVRRRSLRGRMSGRPHGSHPIERLRPRPCRARRLRSLPGRFASRIRFFALSTFGRQNTQPQRRSARFSRSLTTAH